MSLVEEQLNKILLFYAFSCTSTYWDNSVGLIVSECLGNRRINVKERQILLKGFNVTFDFGICHPFNIPAALVIFWENFIANL